MDQILSLVGFAFLLPFYPISIIKVYRQRSIEGFSLWAFLSLMIGTSILTYTSWSGASYWPFVLGNFLNFIGAVWMVLLIVFYRK